MTCGPKESYAYVASRFKCPDGTNPLDGDIERGRDARRGSQPSPNSAHILDVYDVPCAGGKQAVYVDMYGCPQYEKQLAESREGSAAADTVKSTFLAGDFAGVRTQCGSLGDDAPADVRTWCVALVPAALYAEQRASESMTAVTGYCTRLHVATPDSNARAEYLAMVIGGFVTLSSAGKLPLSDEQRDALIQSWLSACEVPAAQLQQSLDELHGE
jgi:hypothetical protein